MKSGLDIQTKQTSYCISSWGVMVWWEEGGGATSRLISSCLECLCGAVLLKPSPFANKSNFRQTTQSINIRT